VVLARIADIIISGILFVVFCWWFWVSVAPETERISWSLQDCVVTHTEVVAPLYDLRAEGRWLLHLHVSWSVDGQAFTAQNPWAFSEYPWMKVSPNYFVSKADAQRVADTRFSSGTVFPCYGHTDVPERRAWSKPSWFQRFHLVALWFMLISLGGGLGLSALYLLVAPYWFVLGSNRELVRFGAGLDSPPKNWVAIRLRDGGAHLRSHSSAFVHSISTFVMIVFLYGSYSSIWMSTDGSMWLWGFGVLLMLGAVLLGLLLMGHILYENRITLRPSEVSIQGFFGIPLSKRSIGRHEVADIIWMREEELDDPSEAGVYVVGHDGRRVCLDNTSGEDVQRWLYALIQQWEGRSA